MNTSFSEPAVIYHSEEDGCWIAHGLRTDQIGTGNRLVDALADLFKAVRSVMVLAQTDPTIAPLREAPEEVQKMLHESKPLPKELSEIAHKMAFGKWPDYLLTDIRPENDDDGSFSAEVTEVGCA